MYTPSGDDRRRALRIPLKKAIQIERKGVTIKATALNLSSTGVRIAGNHGAEVGEQILCKLLFTPNRPLMVAARVVWVRSTEETGPSGMGVMFEDVTETSSAQLARMVDRMRSVSSTTSMAIDPFCESGTWAREDLITHDEPRSSGLPLAVKIALALGILLTLALIAMIVVLQR